MYIFILTLPHLTEPDSPRVDHEPVTAWVVDQAVDDPPEDAIQSDLLTFSQDTLWHGATASTLCIQDNG